MNATDLATRLCKDMVRAVAQRGTRAYIITAFTYPDGESVNLYVENKDSGSWLSDLGTTFFKFNTGGLNLTSPRHQFIQAICNTYGVEIERATLRKQLRSDSATSDCLAFCEALSRISTLEYQRESRSRSNFPELVDGLLKRKVEPARPIDRGWTNPTIDLHKSFPVDYRINGVGEPRHLFHVASAEKSTLVSAVCNFFKAKNAYVPTMSVIDPDLNLGEHHLDRLQLASTQIRFGVIGSEDIIARFGLEGMPSHHG